MVRRDCWQLTAADRGDRGPEASEDSEVSEVSEVPHQKVSSCGLVVPHAL
jgi:hypothetical protein